MKNFKLLSITTLFLLTTTTCFSQVRAQRLANGTSSGGGMYGPLLSCHSTNRISGETYSVTVYETGDSQTPYFVDLTATVEGRSLTSFVNVARNIHDSGHFIGVNDGELDLSFEIDAQTREPHRAFVTGSKAPYAHNLVRVLNCN